MSEPNNMIETEDETLLEQEGEIAVAGIFGEVDSESVVDKFRRDEHFKTANEYHTVVPCQACSSCLEMRRFKPDGKYYTVGYYCIIGEISVDPYGTCNSSHMRARGRHRVLWDATDAPQGFKDGLVPVFPKRYYTKKAQDKDERRYSRNGYKGGTSGYVRPDNDTEAMNSGKIPRGLSN